MSVRITQMDTVPGLISDKTRPLGARLYIQKNLQEDKSTDFDYGSDQTERAS